MTPTARLQRRVSFNPEGDDLEVKDIPKALESAQPLNNKKKPKVTPRYSHSVQVPTINEETWPTRSFSILLYTVIKLFSIAVVALFSQEKKTCLQVMFEPFITLGKGWKTYARQKVVFAGLSLSFLYMTVLGFDSITTGLQFRRY